MGFTDDCLFLIWGRLLEKEVLPILIHKANPNLVFLFLLVYYIL